MQKTVKSGIIFYLCFMCLTASAQEEKEVKPEPEKKNIIKINLPALAFRNISLQYERAIGKKTSVAVNVHTIPFGKLPFQSTIENFGDDADVQFDKLKFGSFGIVPEFRFYLGKNALRGFYIGPFFSYSNYKMDLPIEYGTSKTGIFNGKLNTITGGLQLGAQFRLSNNLTLDWWILGPNYGSASGTLTLAATLSNSERDDLQVELNKLKEDVPLNTIKSAVATNNGATIIAKGPWGGLRGLGFNLGFRF